MPHDEARWEAIAEAPRRDGQTVLPAGQASDASDQLTAQGFDVRGIRPPTVPEGTARLRISITLNVDENQIAAMIGRLALAMEEER